MTKTNINIRGNEGREIGWFEGRNGMSKVYGLSLYMNWDSGNVTTEAVNSRGYLTRGGIAVDLDHWLKITTEFLDAIGYEVRQKPAGNQARYMESDGMYCPHCGSDLLHADPIDATTMSAYVYCNDCKASWYDTYQLTGMIEVHNPNKENAK